MARAVPSGKRIGERGSGARGRKGSVTRPAAALWSSTLEGGASASVVNSSYRDLPGLRGPMKSGIGPCGSGHGP